MNAIEIKIDKLIEEAMLLTMPGMTPWLQNTYAEAKLDNVNSKKDLDAFKKDYSGNSDYKTYDEYPSMAKRGIKYSSMVSVPLAAMGAYNAYHGGDGFNTDELKDNAEMVAGLTGASMVGGAAIPAVGRGIDKLMGQRSLRDQVSDAEAKYK